jgi:uracil-DNA glycosylase
MNSGGSVSDENPLHGTDWGELLEAEFKKPYWMRLQDYVNRQRRLFTIYPPSGMVYRAMELTQCHETKVVIVGQDPYPAKGQADGLAFSVPCDCPKVPDSLKNIRTELRDDGWHVPQHGSLEAWADRGVLLLNAILTVRDGVRLSHEKRGWETFTKEVIRVVAKERDPVFLLWGGKAQAAKRLIAGSPGHILESSHPSNLSARRRCGDSPPFLGSKPFRQANDVLKAQFDWSLPECNKHVDGPGSRLQLPAVPTH